MLLSFLKICLLFSVIAGVLGDGQWHKHGKAFVPDAVLRVTVGNVSQSCLPAKEIVLVNGTSPGPELRLMEGKTYWIRVYNDMPHSNVTMVLRLCCF